MTGEQLSNLYLTDLFLEHLNASQKTTYPRVACDSLDMLRDCLIDSNARG